MCVCVCVCVCVCCVCVLTNFLPSLLLRTKLSEKNKKNSLHQNQNLVELKKL